MCGIFGYIGNRTDAKDIVFEGLKSLEYRGYDSWGVAVVTDKNNGKVSVKKKIGKIGNSNIKMLPQGSLSFGHTRWATHGGVTDVNAHPHLDCEGKIALIHNGIIENYFEIKSELQKKGHKFLSETDTEVAVHLIEEYTKTMSFRDAFRKSFNRFVGLNAIIAARVGERHFLAARNGSPLVIGYGKKANYLASDATAILPHTKVVYFLEENEMAIIKEDLVEVLNVKSGKVINPTKQRLNWTVSQARKGKYPFFMDKEIHEQPLVMRKFLTDYDSNIKELSALIRKSDNVLFSGCGTAHHASIIGKYLLADLSGKRVDTVPSSEFFHFGKFLDKKSFALFFSQSGESIDVVEAVADVKARGVLVGGVTNRLGSALYRAADYKVLLNAGPEICVLSTKSFTAKLSLLLLTSYSLAGKIAEGKLRLEEAIKETEKILSKKYYNDFLEKVVRVISHKNNAYIIGRGLSYPVGMEAALKIKEVSYIHTEAFPGGELKHGVMALIEKGSPCIVFAPHDEDHDSIISNAMEIKARGGCIIGISDKDNPAFDYFCPVANIGPAGIIPQSVVGQLIGYNLAIKLKLDPDKPRNLAKSVTVK